jgi:hypothetical protein
MATGKQEITKVTELQQNPIDDERHHLNDGRWYSPTDTWWEKNSEGEKPYFRSITTVPNVFDKGIGWNKWLGNATSYGDAMDYAEKRANIGTLVHILIERGFMLKAVSFDDEVMGEYLETLDLDFDPHDIWRENRSEIIKYLMSFAQFYTERQPAPLALEIQLMNIEKDEDKYKYPFAGTADFIGSMNCLRDKRKFGYVDWKTGLEYSAHQLQAIATKILWDSIYPDMPLDFLADVYLKSSWRGTPKYRIKWMEFKPEAWRVSLLANQTANYLNNTRVKEPNEEIKPKFPEPLPDEIKLENIEE